ncbi:MAG: hypothetical protein KatS3mg075_502 [Meiothermus sp.]|nr:MAG: hypothetical protein KatS3mg075_502 [Meiothermus sp.]
MSVRITNFGMDAVAAVDSNSAGANRPYFTKWFRYTAVGTGSTAPAQTDTALVSEVARTENNGGFNPSETYVRNSSANVIRGTITEYRVFNFTASYNLTEFGHFTSSSGANCVYRDLFRQNPNDPSSTPVVISVQNGDQLQIIATLIIEVPWLVENYSFDITGIGTINGQGTAFSTIDTYSPIRLLWPGGISNNTQHGDLAAITANGQSPNRDTSVNIATSGPSLSADAYTNGTYQRTKRATMSTSYANGTIYGFVIVTGSTTNPATSGYKFLLSSPASITKSNLYTLTLVFRIEWSRITS